MFRSYLLTLRPTKRQRDALEGVLTLSCDLYNAALQERCDAWAVQRKQIGLYDQYRELAEVRQEDANIRMVASDITRGPLRRVDLAFKGFFRRVKNGEKSGYPRFRSQSRYDSFAFDDPRIIVDRVMVPRLGGIKFKAGQKIKGTAKIVTVKRQGKRWFARITCDIGPAPDKRPVSTAIGVDVGLTNFVTLSNGSIIDNPRWTRQHAERIAAANRALALKKRGSKNRQRTREVLRRAHQRAAHARRNFTHHVSKWLVDNYDLIAYEKLNIKGMVRSNLAKSILDAAWAELVWQISYKAESAGRWAIPVNPRNTTINCSGCGEKVPKTLSQRTHSCPACGLILDRDHNAAINILRLGESLAGIVSS